MKDDPRYKVKNEQVHAVLLEIGRILKKTMPAGYGFTLFVAEYGESGNFFYLSSIQREDMITTLKKFLENMEGKEAQEAAADETPPPN